MPGGWVVTGLATESSESSWPGRERASEVRYATDSTRSVVIRVGSALSQLASRLRGRLHLGGGPSRDLLVKED